MKKLHVDNFVAEWGTVASNGDEFDFSNVEICLPESLLETNVFFLNRDSIFPALQSLRTIATYVFTFTVILMVERRQGETGG